CADAELLFELGSAVSELAVAVSLIAVPSGAEQLTLATRTIVAELPGARVRRVIIWLLPELPQTPPSDEEQDTKVVEDGSVSLTVTDVAASGPLLVTVME